MFIKGEPLTGKVEGSETSGEAPFDQEPVSPPKPLSKDTIKRIKEEVRKYESGGARPEP